MATVLRHRGHKAGEAATMAQLHPSYVGSPFGSVVVVKARAQDSARRWFGTVGTALATATADPARPASWPIRWPCPRCGEPVLLDQEQARHVGQRRNVEVRAAP
jgi:predicted RNA-binding Zn-ribbon protein involved in translation (DUF1610 family)